MSSPEQIINRVSKSSIISLDLETLYPPGERVEYDLAQNLYQGLVLKEMDFRSFVKQYDWTQYEGKHVAITCSADAIIPTWAYMLMTSKLQPYAQTTFLGDKNQLENYLFTKALSKIDPEQYRDAKVVVKGCSNLPVPDAAYVELTTILRPVVASLMFGEPCSTVPVYKKKSGIK